MLSKPKTCLGCKAYGDGKGYVPDAIPSDAELVVLAYSATDDDARGRQVVGYEGKHAVYEACEPQPLLGKVGFEVRSKYVPLTRSSKVGYASLLKCVTECTSDVLTECTSRHLRIPSTVRVVVSVGGDAWAHLQGKSLPLHEWRGFIGPSLLDGRSVFGVSDITDIWKDPSQRLPARLDWTRVGRYLRGEWPKQIPVQIVVGNGDRDWATEFKYLEQCPFVVIDTEYVPDTGLLRMVGICGEARGEVQGLQIEWLGQKVSSAERSEFIRTLSRLVKHVPVVFHNAKADIPIIEQNLHIGYKAYKQVEDTLQAHAVLYSEMAHDLEFIASLVGQYPKMKHLQHENELLYNWGDVLETMEIWKWCLEEFKHDPQSEHVYRTQNLKLIPITLEREARGLRVNSARIESAIPEYESRLGEATRMAEAYMGYPANIGSSEQLVRYLRDVEGFAKLKSIDADTIADLRKKYLPFDSDYEEKKGLTVDYIMERIEMGAHPLLEIRAMYAGDKQTLSHYLMPLVEEM